MDSVFLSCSITYCTVHVLEDLFTSTINRGRKRETAGFCCKLPHLQMRSLLERDLACMRSIHASMAGNLLLHASQQRVGSRSRSFAPASEEFACRLAAWRSGKCCSIWTKTRSKSCSQNYDRKSCDVAFTALGRIQILYDVACSHPQLCDVGFTTLGVKRG